MKRISQNYMIQLKKAAHWRLAPKEAQTMLDDYEEILSHCAYPESELSKEIGTPWQAARQMTEPGHYRRWLTVFTVLTACAIFSGYALVQARLADRRWRAAYALGLTVTVLCIVILAVVTSMSFPFDWQKHCLQSCLFLTFAGLAGTGVSLC